MAKLEAKQAARVTKLTAGLAKKLKAYLGAEGLSVGVRQAVRELRVVGKAKKTKTAKTTKRVARRTAKKAAPKKSKKVVEEVEDDEDEE